jgi:hypothetical protein
MSTGAPQNSGCMVWFTKIFVIAMCLGILAAGVAATKTGWEQWRLNRESGGWPEAEGTVLRAWVDYTQVKTGNQTTNTQTSDMFVVKIDYAVKLDGREFTKTSDAPRQSDAKPSTRPAAEAVTATYEPLSAIPVYYKPGDPENTLRLERVEVASAVWIFLGVGGGLLSIILSLWGAWWTAFKLKL